MQKFSEFVNDYKKHRESKGLSTELSVAKVKKLRELYESMTSKKSKKLEESKVSESEKIEESKNDFDSVLEQYREWKLKNKGTRGVSSAEKEALREKLNKKEEKAHMTESNDGCARCGDHALTYTVAEYIEKSDDKEVKALDPKEIIEAMNENGYVSDLKDDEKVCEACIKEGIDIVLDKKANEKDDDDDEGSEEEFGDNDDDSLFKESVDSFKAVVSRYREWKKANHGTDKLTESEKTSLKEKFLEKVSSLKESAEKASSEKKLDESSAENSRLNEAIAQYKEWKKANHGTDEITKFEEDQIKHGLFLDDVTAKLNEAKKLIESGKKHLTEGDVMDAGADAGAAADVVNNIAAPAADDPNAMAADPTAPDAQQPASAANALPQNIVDEIAQIKASIDSLATECGLESPVSVEGDAQEGVPAITGATDPNAVVEQAPDAAAPAPAPDAAPAEPLPESIKTIKQRIAARNKQLKETIKFSDTKMVDGAKEDLVKIPSEEELVKGTKKGKCSAADWPIKDVKPENPQKLKNLEECSQEELSKMCLDENSEFSWELFKKLLKNM